MSVSTDDDISKTPPVRTPTAESSDVSSTGVADALEVAVAVEVTDDQDSSGAWKKFELTEESPIDEAPVAIDDGTLDDESVDLFGENSCSQCGQELGLGTKVCCNCGYYATIGKFVKIEKPKEEEPDRIPWELLAIPVVCLLIIGEAVAARYLTHPESPDRRMFSFAHLILGSLLFLIPHLRAQYLSYREDAKKTGAFGFLLHPFKIWKVVLKKLPKSMPWMLAASAGLTAVVCSFIIGGIPSPFSKEPIKWQPPKKDITISIPKGKSHGVGAQSMEQAIEQLTEVTIEHVEELKSEKPRIYEDCAIVGYTLAAPDRVGSIIVAKKVQGVTRLVGSVSTGIPGKVRVKLANRLRRIPTDEPLVDGAEGMNWVEPEYFCRVWFNETADGGRGRLNFDRMLVLKKSTAK